MGPGAPQRPERPPLLRRSHCPATAMEEPGELMAAPVTDDQPHEAADQPPAEELAAAGATAQPPAPAEPDAGASPASVASPAGGEGEEQEEEEDKVRVMSRQLSRLSIPDAGGDDDAPASAGSAAALAGLEDLPAELVSPGKANFSEVGGCSRPAGLLLAVQFRGSLDVACRRVHGPALAPGATRCTRGRAPPCRAWSRPRSCLSAWRAPRARRGSSPARRRQTSTRAARA